MLSTRERGRAGVVVSGVVQDRREWIGTRPGRGPGRAEGHGGIIVTITNRQVAEHAFLLPLYEDDYFPDHVLDRGRAVLLRLCERIEAERPGDLAALYRLTEGATEEFNALEADFEAAGSEIETVAREEIGEAFWFIAQAYGFADADGEQLIAAREW
ncbi:hypothetical protein YUYDRAFT_01623 [Streptomyces sp. ScaeMP-e48]|nr:hypothetical protein YUYDRAFT_01623 [Streptomyces sp. ScaeMP-e48]